MGKNARPAPAHLTERRMVMEDIKFYGIEYRGTYYGQQYRWYSKYNGARGPWTGEELARKGGVEHEKIIKQLHEIRTGEQE
jgi:hypothetical protein